MPETGFSPEASSASQASSEKQEDLEAKLPASSAIKHSLVMAIDGELGAGEETARFTRMADPWREVTLDRHEGVRTLGISRYPHEKLFSVSSTGDATRSSKLDQLAGMANEMYVLSPTGDEADPWRSVRKINRGGERYRTPDGKTEAEMTEADGKQLLDLLSRYHDRVTSDDSE